MIPLQNSVIFIFVITLMCSMEHIWAKSFKDNIQHWKTHQGANVYFYHTNESPVVQFSLLFGAGRGVDEHGGASVFANSLMLYDNKLSERDSITNKLDRIGAHFSTYIDVYSSILTMDAIMFEQEFPNAINLLHNIIVNPIFNQKEFIRNKKQYLDNMNNTYQTPSDRYSRALLETIFSDHPMGRYLLPSEIETVQKEDVSNFYKKYYVAKNATLLMVGNLSISKARNVSEELLSDMPAGEKAQPLVGVPFDSFPGKKIFIQDNAIQQTSIKFGELGIASNDPDFMALRLGIDIFAGGSLNSRLPNAMRNEHGYSYNTTCEMADNPSLGYFYCETSVANANAPEAFRLMLSTLRQYLRDGPSEAEVECSKKNLRLTYYTVDSNSGILKLMTSMAEGYRTWDYWDNYLTNVNRITPEQIKRALQKHIHMDRFTFVIWGPKDIRNVIQPDLLKLH